ncbi:Peptidase S8/S53 subtilisin/kexin/sedolisin [Lasiodiplodia theobromae]|uniref:Alkaline protease 2 n=1 Tax=Lasiodiplodia theobromae TaxID=45133 RepID=A0A5N5D4B9_9PEZI|nr:Peptidase S8/S53 subtilisin/kexin/sedolisin [Lasiodiplodia theobromae]KAB2572555.1 Alkaline protease 2 [Lasiodiplodia theobromae]KAF4536011.1 Peptidase S8/S53 subtilisin/kexin/sedolisin [Lasiodiplodia theobromae]
MKHAFAASAAALSLLGSASAWTIPIPANWNGNFMGFNRGSSDETFAEDLAALASAVATSTAPATAAATGSSHESGGEEHLVIFNASHPTTPDIEEILNRLELSSNHSDVRYVYDNSVFRGFSANMKEHCIKALGEMVEVETVEKSTVMSASFRRGKRDVSARRGSPWGLQRISSSLSVPGNATDGLAFTYSFENSTLGKGVDIYVVDTGINVDHIAFQGRAKNGWTAYPDNKDRPVDGWTDERGNYTDGAGHGTHVSGTSAGATLGIAPGANIINVRVLDADGGGLSADTIAGISWVINQHDKRKNESDFVGSILSMSFGTSEVAAALSSRIIDATRAGIHASVAAGNEGKDACDFSPSNAGGSNSSVVTVGSIGINDEISSFSNTGSCVDVYAPGEDILSSYIGGDNVVEYLDGTSMACPHVTGVMAYLLEKEPALRQDPAAMKARLTSSGLLDSITGLVLDTKQTVLLNNGVTSASLGKKRQVSDDDDELDALTSGVFVLGDGDAKSKKWW